MRAPSPRVLLAASLVLFAITAIGVVLTRHGRAPATTPAAVPQPAPAPPPPAVRVTAGAFAAVVSWRGDPAAPVSWGPAGMRPLLRAAGRDGRLPLGALFPNTRYRVSVGGVGTATFRTALVPPTARAATGGGVLRVDGAPFFPLIAWEECPGRWAPDLAAGVNLFGGNPCTGLSNLLTALRGRALAAGTTEDVPGTTGPGLIGWFLADEADARGYTETTLPAPGGPGIRFLTLTSHFFPLAAPLPAGRGMYPGLAAKADVLGVDLYPLQELCRPELLPWVFDAQRELLRLAGGKPTFQWIEEREMKCPQTPVTPATIRAEAWLAIAGGATGLAFFPSDWSPGVTYVIRGIANRIRQLEPALLTRPRPVIVTPAAPTVRASAREFGGRRYVIAVNAGTAAARVALDGVEVTLPPLGVRLLVGDEQALRLG
ncbi:MAG TPA: hypothetical protein VIK66_02190 [Gaiellaceae bacterium]|jgi:hypothetical protein